MKRKPLPKPRNPFVEGLITKKQGAHGKTKKAMRRAEKVRFQKDDYPQIAA